MIAVRQPPKGTPPLQRPLYSWVGSHATRKMGGGGYADDNVATGRVTQAKQASVEKPDKTCH